MSDTLGPLMERNLLEVFGQRDSARRAAAIAELYTADCTFFEAEEQVNGPGSAQREGREYSQGCSRFRVSRGRACAGQSRSWPFAVAVRTCRSPAGCHGYGHCGLRTRKNPSPVTPFLMNPRLPEFA